MRQFRQLTWKQHLTHFSCAVAFVFSLATYQQEMISQRSRFPLTNGQRDFVGPTPALGNKPSPERFRRLAGDFSEFPWHHLSARLPKQN